MIVTCPNCSTRYNLPDAKIPAGGAKVKCSKCAHVFKAELPTPEEEVENLLEEDSPAAPDTQAGDEFDETFNEVASSDAPADDTPAEGDSPIDEPADEPAEDPVPEESADESPAGDDLFDDAPDESPDDDMAGLDDLFDDSDEAPTPDEGPSPTGGDEDAASADDVESLFGDDDDDGGLFDDQEESDEDPADLFGDADDADDGDDDDNSDLFADEDDDEEDDDDEEYEDDDEDEDTDFGLDSDEEPKKKKGGKSLGCLIIILVLVLGIGAAVYFKVWTMFGVDLGSYFQNVPYVGKMFMEETGGSEEAAPGESPADRVRKIELKNVKQYYVANEKTGNLFVVEGKAVNKFANPKEQIKVEVVLYDGNGSVLATQSFLCGNVLSQFQLQVQTQKEIEDGLASEVGILSNNTFIRPGASTPFMAVFFKPPAGVKEFLVKVVDVGDPE